VFCLAVGSWVAVCRLHPHVRRSVAGLSPGLLLRRTGPGRDDPDRSRACTNGPRTGGGPPGSAGLECSAKNVVTVGLMRNDLSRVLTEAVWEAKGTDSLYVWLPRKVAMESSSSVHHGVWWTGAMVRVQGEEKDRSRYPVMLAILSCSHSLKCARVKSMS